MYERLQHPNVTRNIKKNEHGRLILRNYSQTKTLSKYSQHILVELLTSHLLNIVRK